MNRDVPETGVKRVAQTDPPGRAERTFAQNVLLLAGGTAAAQLLVVLASPILTRVYDPAAFGIHGVYTSLLMILLSFTALRYETAIPVAPDQKSAGHLLALSVLITLGIAGGAGLVIWALTEAEYSWGAISAVQPYVWLLPFGIIFGGTYQILTYWMVREGSFRAIARTRAGQSFGQVTSQVALGFAGAGPLGLIVGEIIGRSGGTLSLGRGASQDIKRGGTRITARGIVEAGRQYHRFPLISAPSAAINTAGIRIPALMLAAIYPAAVVGWFALSQRIIAVPLSLIGQSVGQVYFREGGRRAREEPHTLPEFFEAHTKRLALLALLPTVLLATTAPVLFPLVFGDAWRQAGWFAALLAPLLYAQLSVSPLSQTIFIIERQDLQFWWDVARLGVLIILFGAVRALGLSAGWAVGLYSLSMTLMYVVLLHIYRQALADFVRRIRNG